MNGHIENREQRLQSLIEAHEREFPTSPSVGVRSPGRVDLMGSHTDYNEGFVLTLTIDRDTWIVASPSNEDTITLRSLNLDSTCSFALGDTEVLDGWGRYVQAVAMTLSGAGYPIRGFHGVVHSTIPISSGLSSSAALEAAVATLFEQLGDFTLDKLEKASLCQQAENEIVGVNCGILDQYSSVFGEQGKAVVLDCRSLSHKATAIPSDLRPVICNTCAPRKLTGSEYGERREQCEKGAAYFNALDSNLKTLRDVSPGIFADHEANLPHLVAMRSKFIIQENARVAELAGALEENDRSRIRTIMAASFIGARDLFEIGVPAMQSMFDSMSSAPGCVGCRQAGAGFGGCMIALVESNKTSDFIDQVKDTYERETGIHADVYPIRSSAGSGVLPTFR